MFGCFAVGPFMSFFSVELLLPSWKRLCNFVALSNEIRARPMLEKKPRCAPVRASFAPTASFTTGASHLGRGPLS